MIENETRQTPTKRVRKAGIRAVNERTIIDSGEELFAKYGFRGTSMSMVAERASVPKANLYHYFNNKEDLYRRVLDRTHKWWGDASLAIDQFDNPVDALGAYVDRKMDMSRENYFGSKVWASEVIQGAPMLTGYLKTEVYDWTQTQVARINRWIEAGKMRPVEPLPFLLMVWATTQWYADFEYEIRILNHDRDFTDSEYEAAKKTVREIILRGIEARR